MGRGKHTFRQRALPPAALVLLFVCADSLPAIPLHLTVRPKGTNQVEVTLGPVVTNEYYQVLARTNSPKGHWIRFAGILTGSNTTVNTVADLGHIEGLTLGTLRNWRFVAGRWDDPLGDELPPLYKELVLRMDPYASGDPYADPMADGWSNIQKLQNDMNPLACYAPPAPRLSATFRDTSTNGRLGNAILTWELQGGPVPDYFIVERANRTLRPQTNDAPYIRPGLYGAYGARPLSIPTNGMLSSSTNRPPNWPPAMPLRGRTNRPPGWPTNRPYAWQTNRPTTWPTNRTQNWPGNRPPGLIPGLGRRAGFSSETMVTGPFVEIARVPGQAGITAYRYVDTNVDTLFQPQYRVAAHNVPPSHAYLNQVDARAIRSTLIAVPSLQTTNGYLLTVPHPIPYAWYLLLVRDRKDSQWRASGYFASGTNRDPVQLRVDKKGMMSDGQSPIAMPPVRFLPDVVAPEFMAGWGEDSDGDGLPDIYEVMVTHTLPDDADTGGTGILDGFKEMTGDGWSNLEKFRRRVDPLRTAKPPPSVDLRQPTGAEIIRALTPKSNLHCEVQIAVRTNGAPSFQPIEQVPWFLSKVLSFRQPDEHRKFDVRVSWQFAEPKPSQSTGVHFPGELSWYEAVEPLVGRINLELMTSFKAQLETNPPLPWGVATNLTAETVRAYREGDMDKGLAMAEMMLAAENVAQDFYGKVIDQHGRPVVEATATATTTRESSKGEAAKTQTDAKGLFQFTGLRGRSLNIALEKNGFQIEGHGLGLKNLNGPESSPTNRVVYTMWKLKGAEPMIHDRKTYLFKPDNRIYTIDLLSKKMVEGTNEPGDLQVQFHRPAEIKRGDHYEWSFTLTAIGGGVIEVANDDYLNEAPVKGYQPTFSINMLPENPKWRGYGEETFYTRSRKGQAYGHIHLKIYPESRDGSSLEVESYVNPTASRNLEFDPAKQTEYVPRKERMESR